MFDTTFAPQNMEQQKLRATGLELRRQTSACRFLNLTYRCTSLKTPVNYTASLNTAPICLRENDSKMGGIFYDTCRKHRG
ncbi:hypothetical protein QNN00_16320 [Bacillus velezensis]|nr:hypothetical protein [Bacillus velezensis]